MVEQSRKNYLGLKSSLTRFFSEPVRYLKSSNQKESQFEKPYRTVDYPKMHLRLPDWKWGDWPNEEARPAGGLMITPWHLDFMCWTKNCVDTPGEVTIECTQFVVAVDIAAGTGFSVGGIDDTTFSLSALDGAEGPAILNVKMRAPDGRQWRGAVKIVTSIPPAKPFPISEQDSPTGFVYGWHHGISISLCDQCKCAGTETIGYTTQQMALSEVQTLSVTGAATSASCYEWAISSGGGSLSTTTGTSVDYTAPASNADCSGNPTITLSCDGVVLDSLSIAISNTAIEGTAVVTWQNLQCVDAWPWNASLDTTWKNCSGAVTYTCTLWRQGGTGGSCAIAYEKTDTANCYSGAATMNSLLAGSPYDKRTAGMIAGGCCLAELL